MDNCDKFNKVWKENKDKHFPKKKKPNLWLKIALVISLVINFIFWGVIIVFG